jgi:superfamily II RNA helicase
VEFKPLTATEFHQMTGRAGRRGKDRIGFAVAIPGKFMNIRWVAKLVASPPTAVFSQIKINFSMALNLLLSHSPPQIEDLLEKSFATFQMLRRKKQMQPRSGMTDRKFLWKDFQRHLHFLEEKGFISSNGALTDDGRWASGLRIDQPLLVAEGLRRKMFPESDPVLLAAIFASFVSDRESDDRVQKKHLPKKVLTAFLKMRKGLRPFARDMFQKRFDVHPLYIRPAAALYAWATGKEWEEVLSIGEMEEGDLAMLIMRTADHLRHLRSLNDTFPAVSQNADQAIDLILREPVVS